MHEAASVASVFPGTHTEWYTPKEGKLNLSRVPMNEQAENEPNVDDHQCAYDTVTSMMTANHLSGHHRN